MDSVVWAFKHTMRIVADIGLNILLTLLQKFAINDQAGNQFFQTYFLDILQHIFSVVTDTSHTASMFHLSPSPPGFGFTFTPLSLFSVQV